MRIGDTEVPEMEIQLSDPAPYDWKNQPAPPKPYISNFKIETPPSSAQDEPEVPQKPQPFSFGFMSMAKDGQQSRMESQDASGRVTGSYSIVDANGITRIVEYYADDTGFHANIKSNENGIETGELGSATITKL
ncbi:PREDICTED: cuticle protein 10.9-like [Rhagoletis zephyria]|uniref:cuticle protein 10.9-like n=1 Tax=Rhagoletis zephyria TaxID=28612 RepID=UPI00081127F4|nr:PREDICTED: cuticle protein 10.9-like [Rhagoletis zephyria]